MPVSYTHLDVYKRQGHSLFNASDKGQHQYLMIQGNENIQRTLGAIVRQVTGKEEKNINQ